MNENKTTMDQAVEFLASLTLIAVMALIIQNITDITWWVAFQGIFVTKLLIFFLWPKK